MGKIHRFTFPKYRSKVDPSDRSGTYILGIGLAAGSALLSRYGIVLAIGIFQTIAVLFVVGLFWEHYPTPVRTITWLIGVLGGAGILVSITVFLIFFGPNEMEPGADPVWVIVGSLCSAGLGALFFADVVRGARASGSATG